MKKTYMKPSMKVVELKNRTQLLTGSNPAPASYSGNFG